MHHCSDRVQVRLLVWFFFFSSRRRHTRCGRDWSSDVCSSDLEGFTIAASEAREIAQIAKRTVISDDALSVLVPLLEEIAGFGPSQIRALFEDQGLVIQEWDRVRTDWLTIRDGAGDGVIRLDAAASA